MLVLVYIAGKNQYAYDFEYIYIYIYIYIYVCVCVCVCVYIYWIGLFKLNISACVRDICEIFASILGIGEWASECCWINYVNECALDWCMCMSISGSPAHSQPCPALQ